MTESRYVTARSLTGRRGVSDEERLRFYLSRVQIDSETGCWYAPGYVSQGGYRRIRHHGRMIPLHRFVFEQIHDTVPADKQLHHVCRNKQCLYPRHLEVLTASEHTRLHPETREAIVAERLRRDRCSKGHRYTPENTYVLPGTRKRTCRICQREIWRRHDRRRRSR